MSTPRYPSLYQINTRVRLCGARGRSSGGRRRWTTSPTRSSTGSPPTASTGSGSSASGRPGGRAGASRVASPSGAPSTGDVLPDLREEDICGSCFAIRAYDVHDDFGGDEALARLRARLDERGLRLMLDFVPNHTAPDHPWVDEHPEYFVARHARSSSPREPQNYSRVETGRGARVLALRARPLLRRLAGHAAAQLRQRRRCARRCSASCERIAARCDGVRCDMAMLVLPEVFERTWGICGRGARSGPRRSPRSRQRRPGFLFMAEVYWDLEWTLQQQGFDYTYDKRLYDRLRDGHARAGPRAPARRTSTSRSARRASSRTTTSRGRRPPSPRDDAPGGRRHHLPRAGPALLPRGPARGAARRASRCTSAAGRTSPDRRAVAAFYDRLLALPAADPAVRDGDWQLLGVPRRPGTATGRTDCFVAFAWTLGAATAPPRRGELRAHQGQCYVTLPCPTSTGGTCRLGDLLGDAATSATATSSREQGLYLDMPAWGHHVFAVSPAE